MSRIGLGLAALGRPAYITSSRGTDLGGDRTVDCLRKQSWSVLDRAYALGIRYIDLARSYGRSEEFAAGWLNAHPDRDDVVVGSKWGYRYVGEWRTDADVHEVKDHSLAAFRRQLAETRDQLGDRLAVYHVHSATLETGALEDLALHRALAELRDEGVRVGVSTSGPDQAAAVRRALAVTVEGRPLFTSIQATWNLLETSAADALAEAHAADAQVIVKEAVANGRLTAGGADGDDTAERAAAIAAECGIGLDQLAIAAALAQPWAGRVLSGAVTTDQLESNADAAGIRLSAEVLGQLTALAEAPADYWARRSR
ncbi:MAG: aldo/keto reductase, partial [Alphaproteobacteria bacterium]|nr:aldo/keto reductase [Alphaproteobacteria bacterium]